MGIKTVISLFWLCYFTVEYFLLSPRISVLPPHPTFSWWPCLTVSVKKAIRSILLQENLFCPPSLPLHLSPYTLVSLVLLGSDCPWNGKGQSRTCAPALFPRHLLKATSQQVPSHSPCAGSLKFPSLPHRFISIQICCYFSHLKSKTPTGPPHSSDHHQSDSLKRVVPFSISCHSPLNVLHPSLGSSHSVETALGSVPSLPQGASNHSLVLTLPGLSAACDIVGDKSLLQDRVFSPVSRASVSPVFLLLLSASLPRWLVPTQRSGATRLSPAPLSLTKCTLFVILSTFMALSTI